VSLAERVVEEFEGNVRLRKRLAELLVVEPDVRLTLINALLAEVATKRDISEVRSEFKTEINELRREINSNFRWTIGVVITVLGSSSNSNTSKINRSNIKH